MRETAAGAYEMPLTPEIEELFRVALHQLRLTIRTTTVGTVISYNAATQRARVSVDSLMVVRDNATPPTAADPLPTKELPPIVLNDVPVAWPRTGLGYLTFPLGPGDSGELHVHDRSLANYLATGQAADPGRSWTHSLEDCVFWPCRFDTPSPIVPPTSTTAATIEGPTVKIGAAAVEPAIKASTFIGLMDAMITAAVAAAAPVVPPVGDGGTAAFTAFQVAWNAAKATINATKARVE
jgi:hypothetical protein